MVVTRPFYSTDYFYIADAGGLCLIAFTLLVRTLMKWSAEDTIGKSVDLKKAILVQCVPRCPSLRWMHAIVLPV